MDTTSPSIPLPGDIIDVSNPKQLPTHDIIVNMDGGVGGSWRVENLKLMENEQKSFKP